jgi:cobalt-zinc-cadmium efflux system membrane fusion protein
VQLSGETFEKRHLKLGKKDHGFIQVLAGLSEGEYVAAKGAYAVAEAEHKGPDDHQHPMHAGEPVVQLSEEDIRKFGIEVDRAGPGEFEVHLSVPGEIVINTDRMAHIVPRVPGIVREVKKKLGDSAKKGEVMAVMESRDLADAKTIYLASIERFELANTVFEREAKLWKEKISSEQEYLDAKKAFAEAKIQMRSAGQKLRALGFNAKYLEKLPSEPAELLTTFEITAPFDGTIIQKHITLGEVIKEDEDVFVVADLDTVWVDLQVHQNDVAVIKKGQKMTIWARSCVPETEGVIDYIDPVIDEKTRTALARAVLDNSAGQLRPGTFVTASVLVEKRDAEVVVAKSILQDVDDKTCVFVQDEHGFEPRAVAVGLSNGGYVEIVAGLKPGEKIVTKNSFRLKAELKKDAGGGHAGHGHAH